jgi:GT2 family glycosyltransferase
MLSVKFSVVIPTCDRLELLRSCLDALSPATQSYRTPFETIVSDDGREPVGDFLEANYPWVRWVRGPRLGPAANRNNGAARAQGDWLAFVDDDCIPHVGWLKHYAEGIAAYPTARAFEGSIHPVGDLGRDLAECPVNLNGNCFWSANICVQRALFAQLDGFDQRFRIAAHEDQDLFLRIKKHTIVPFIAEAAVSHPVRYGTLRGWVRQMNSATMNWIQFAKAHREELGYQGDWGIIGAGYMGQMRAAYWAARRGYPRQFCKSLTMLFYGLPIGAYRLLVAKNLSSTQ